MAIPTLFPVSDVLPDDAVQISWAIVCDDLGGWGNIVSGHWQQTEWTQQPTLGRAR